MSYKIAHTPDGIVVRDIWPSGERSYRFNKDETWCVTDHKGPWVTTSEKNVPLWVLLAAGIESAEFRRR